MYCLSLCILVLRYHYAFEFIANPTIITCKPWTVVYFTMINDCIFASKRKTIDIDRPEPRFWVYPVIFPNPGHRKTWWNRGFWPGVKNPRQKAIKTRAALLSRHLVAQITRSKQCECLIKNNYLSEVEWFCGNSSI